MSTEKQYPAKAIWTVGKVMLCAVGGILIVAGIVICVAVLCRDSNARQVAAQKDAESKQIASTRQKSLNAPPEDSSGAPSDDDPVVRQSQLKAHEKSFWKRTVDHVSRVSRSIKDFIVKCQTETPQIRTPGQRGRVQNDIRRVQFELAILYQMSHGQCSRLNACRRSFLRVENGYKSCRSLYDFWGQHPLDADDAKQSLAQDLAESNMSPQKFYERYKLENAAKLQEITA